MSDQFLAEIRMFAGNFAPQGWALCNGQLMPLSQNTALFSLLGTNYGGDGKSTFALPNLQGMAPLQQGQGGGLSRYDLGQSDGVSSVTLQPAEMPSHTHTPRALDASGNTNDPSGAVLAEPAFGRRVDAVYSASTSGLQTMAAAAIGTAGSNQPHNNLPPYLAVTFIIALQGVFPQRP